MSGAVYGGGTQKFLAQIAHKFKNAGAIFLCTCIIIFSCIADEIGAIVCDVGSNTVRVGYAGEDSPRFDIPTTVGALRHSDMEKKFNIGIVAIHVRKPEMDMVTFMKDGMVEDWELFENFMDHIYNYALHTESENHPMLMTEPAVCNCQLCACFVNLN